VHKVVITCWCWHFCEGVGVWAVERLWVPLSLSPSLRARDSGVFEDLKCLFSTTPEVGEETEANGGHSGDRTLNRTRSRFDRTRPVSSSRQSGARVLGSRTSASGHSRDRRVRSGAQRELQNIRSIGRVRSRWDLTGLKPNAECSASGRLSGASGRCVWLLAHSDRWRIGRPCLNLERTRGRCRAIRRGWARPVRFDRHVRSSRKTPSKGVQQLYSFGMLINTCWLALGEVSWHFLTLLCILWTRASPSYSSLLLDCKSKVRLSVLKVHCIAWGHLVTLVGGLAGGFLVTLGEYRS
jgi:hypothetical protein